MMNHNAKKLAAAVSFSLFAGSAAAVPFSEIRIGDNDGFGYDADPNFASLTGDGGAADRNSDGHLGPTDVLPSHNGDSTVATGSGDDFDNRNGESVSGTGFTDTGTQGTEFTDISLSTSYDSSSSSNQVYNANDGTSGSGGTFPAGSSTSLPNQPGFSFLFEVSQSDILAGTPIFFNMVFADYDVTPAAIDFVFASGSKTIGVTPQNNSSNDGLIQGAFATLDFYDVFTNTGSGIWGGEVAVNFDAPREPYTAFDYVELSVEPLVVDVPEPGTLALFALGLTGLLSVRGMSRRAA
ncbi:PEP-CTERM sorting domain-containing protein [Marinobacter halotolerans]|uniref:PEP-CTERM sorting domain-containing protein n=1 Tax=Marinobacter halotolerans TaxID=1569211 RepID=UPI0017875FCB|nr:PEP-CTERM sorting domain-containing protein [Marinobacter halotolerans]